MADWFLVGEDFAYLSDIVASFVAYGIGFGAVAWLIGQVLAFIWSVIRF